MVEEDDLKSNAYRSGSAPTIMKTRAPDSDDEKEEKERQLQQSSTSSVRAQLLQGPYSSTLE